MTKRQLTCRTAALVLAFVLPSATWLQAASDNWPNFRGPSLDGSAQAQHLPETWNPQDGVHWSAKLPGPGSSTPAVWANRIFLTAADGPAKGGQVLALCLDAADGKQLWSHPLGPNRQVGYDDMTSPSPVTDGQHVIYLSGTGRMLACDFAGQQLWSRDLQQEFGALSWNFGYAASPLLYDGRLYVQLMRRPRGTVEPFLLAIDPATGKDLWKQPRPGEALEESWESYITPTVHNAKSGPQIVLIGADAVTGHDPQTGRELWRYPYNERRQRNWRVVPTPVSDGQRLFVALPRGTELIALEPAEGTAPLSEHTQWKLTANVPDVCSPLLYDGRLYILDGDRRVMTCLDPKTGRQLWRGELGGNTVIRSSPTAADGKIYCIDERGQVFILAAGEEFRLLAHIDMAGGQPSRSSITIAANCLYLRTADALHCIAPSGAKP